MNTKIVCYPYNVTGWTTVEPNTGRAIGTGTRSGRQVRGISILGGPASVANHCAIAHSAALMVSPPV